MKTISLFGTGKSATCLIDYLGKTCDEKGWQLLVSDANLLLAESKVRPFANAKAFSFDVTDTEQRQAFIVKADLVISMMPPSLHLLIAKDCITFSKNLLMASYINKSLHSLAEEIEKKGLLFIGELGLDPGIDHMSAMNLINKIKNEGGKIRSFKSHCGGLVAPENDTNPWHYKISWNPRNVVTAGSSGARFKEEGRIKEVAYQDIFAEKEQNIQLQGLEPLAWYPNRDSLSYIKTYDLDEIKTFMRTTIRYPAFIRGWNKLVQLDLTNQNDYEDIKNCKTFADWFELKKSKMLDKDPSISNAFFDSELEQQIDFLSMRSEQKLPQPISDSASALQFLLEKHLVLNRGDKDLVVMLHEIEFTIAEKKNVLTSSLIVKGKDAINTAMAKTVGLPLGITAKLILEKEINLTGLHIPVIPEIYLPVLKELELNGIQFHEERLDL